MPETEGLQFCFLKILFMFTLKWFMEGSKVNFILAKFAKFDEYRGIQYKPIFLRFKKKIKNVLLFVHLSL